MSNIEAKEAAGLTLEAALALVKAAGYRVSKPKPKKKDRVGPTFVAVFADGQVTRMSTFTSLADLDIERGKRLSLLAYEARNRNWFNLLGLDMAVDIPAIIAARFEQDGVPIWNS